MDWSERVIVDKTSAKENSNFALSGCCESIRLALHSSNEFENYCFLFVTELALSLTAICSLLLPPVLSSPVFDSCHFLMSCTTQGVLSIRRSESKSRGVNQVLLF